MYCTTPLVLQTSLPEVCPIHGSGLAKWLLRFIHLVYESNGQIDGDTRDPLAPPGAYIFFTEKKNKIEFYYIPWYLRALRFRLQSMRC